MTWKKISTGSTFEKMASYSRALYDDEWVFVSGTSGFDYTTMEISDDFGTQARQMWKNVASALEQAGSGLDEIVSFLLVIKDLRDLPVNREILKEVMPHKPTGMAISAVMVDERIKVEVQATAKKKATAK
jgi:enamine deaminase RidA (YjgF/YER057c/UK114 family)